MASVIYGNARRKLTARIDHSYADEGDCHSVEQCSRSQRRLEPSASSPKQGSANSPKDKLERPCSRAIHVNELFEWRE